MTATTLTRTRAPAQARSSQPVARLSLALDVGRGSSDGVWWPHTTNLSDEVPALDLAIQAKTGARIAHVSYTLGGWAPASRKLWTTLGMTKLGWFTHSIQPDTVGVSLSDYTHLTLTVIPPGTAPDVAENAMVDVGGPTHP